MAGPRQGEKTDSPLSFPILAHFPYPFPILADFIYFFQTFFCQFVKGALFTHCPGAGYAIDHFCDKYVAIANILGGLAAKYEKQFQTN